MSEMWLMSSSKMAKQHIQTLNLFTIDSAPKTIWGGDGGDGYSGGRGDGVNMG